MRLNSRTLFLTLVLFILGVALSMQFRAQSRINSLAYLSRVELTISKIQNLESQRDALQDENKQLKQRIQDLESTSKLELMSSEIANYRQSLGLTPVAGKGIVVTLDDSKKAKEAGENPNLYLIHDSDIREVIQAMLIGGADAVAVNGQRFVFSSFRLICGGPTILVNGERMVPPYKISAIGDPDRLSAELEKSRGILEALRSMQLEVSVAKSDQVNLPAYVGNVNLTQAQPVQ